jgi:hypothetical protein
MDRASPRANRAGSPLRLLASAKMQFQSRRPGRFAIWRRLWNVPLGTNRQDDAILLQKFLPVEFAELGREGWSSGDLARGLNRPPRGEPFFEAGRGGDGTGGERFFGWPGRF